MGSPAHCGWHHSLGRDPGVYKQMEKVSCCLECICNIFVIFSVVHGFSHTLLPITLVMTD